MSSLLYVLPTDVSEELLPLIDDARFSRQFDEQKGKLDRTSALLVILESHCLGNCVFYNLIVPGSFTGQGHDVRYQTFPYSQGGKIEHTDSSRVRRIEDKVYEIENKHKDRIWSDWDCDGV